MTDTVISLPLEAGVALRSAYSWALHGQPEQMQRYIDQVDADALTDGIRVCTEVAVALAKRRADLLAEAALNPDGIGGLS